MTRSRAAAAVAALLIALTQPATAQRGPMHSPTHLPAEVLALVCAPQLTFEPPQVALRLTGGQDAFVRRQYGPGDLLTINGGTDHGIEVGQEYYVRRVQTESSERVSRATPASIRTAGWIRVWAVDREMSLATVIHACDSLEVDDYLEPFVMPVVPAFSTERAKPQRGNYGRILFGADQRRSFGKDDFFIVDRGSDHGVAPGDRFVIYRDKRVVDNFLFELGEAVAVEVRSETSTLKATLARDAFTTGDYVAIRKAPVN